MIRIAPLLVLALLAVSTVAGAPGVADAASTPEQRCQKGRYAAAAQYAACQQNAVGVFYKTYNPDPFVDSSAAFFRYLALAGKCRTKYAGLWPKLALKARGTGSSCDTPRFSDHGATVSDNLTGLEWEKKTTDGTVHDKGNLYAWNASPPFTAADGTLFTQFLTALNGSGCFAGQCDWRIPTHMELQTLASKPYPCPSDPCFDPIFGPANAGYSAYWSSTEFAIYPLSLWMVDFHDAIMLGQLKSDAIYARAVRGGL